jgi:hypothetical protein
VSIYLSNAFVEDPAILAFAFSWAKALQPLKTTCEWFFIAYILSK